eukprot:gene7605-24333_t
MAQPYAQMPAQQYAQPGFQQQPYAQPGFQQQQVGMTPGFSNRSVNLVGWLTCFCIPCGCFCMQKDCRCP